MTPEHLHLVLVHLPIVGLLAALIPLGWAVLRRDRTAAALGLAIAAAFALVTPLVAATGDRAEERLEHAPPPFGPDLAGGRWLEVHEERAEAGAIVVYVAAGLLAVGLAALVKRPEQPALTRALAAGGLVTCALSLATLVWVADAGGKVRHAELRADAGAAPAPAVRDDD